MPSILHAVMLLRELHLGSYILANYKESLPACLPAFPYVYLGSQPQLAQYISSSKRQHNKSIQTILSPPRHSKTPHNGILLSPNPLRPRRLPPIRSPRRLRPNRSPPLPRPPNHLPLPHLAPQTQHHRTLAVSRLNRPGRRRSVIAEIPRRADDCTNAHFRRSARGCGRVDRSWWVWGGA